MNRTWFWGSLASGRISMQYSGSVLEDEKVEGTFHLAFGHNDFFGGRIKDKFIKGGKKCLHLDLVMKKPEFEFFT